MDSAKHKLARQLMKDRNFSQVLVVANDLLAANSSDLEAQWLLSAAYFELGDDASAESVLRRYLKADPHNAEAIGRLTAILRRQKRQSEAKELLQSRLVDQQHPMLLANLADLYLESGDSDQAILNANKALQLEPESVLAHMVLGSTFILLGTPKEALKYLNAAAEISPSNPQIYINLAGAYDIMEEHLKQFECLELALMCDNSLIGLYPLLANCSLNLGNRDSAVRYLERSLECDPNNPEIQLNLAKILESLDQPQKAIDRLLELVKKYPENEVAWEIMCRCFKLTGQYEKSAMCSDQLNKIRSNVSSD